MKFKTKLMATVAAVTTLEDFIATAHKATQASLIRFEGQTRSRGSLTAVSNGTQVSYTWRDRGGIREGWESKTIPLNQAPRRLQAVERY